MQEPSYSQAQQLSDQYGLVNSQLQDCMQTWFNITQIGSAPLFTEAEREARSERMYELVQRLEYTAQNVAGSAGLLRSLLSELDE